MSRRGFMLGASVAVGGGFLMSVGLLSEKAYAETDLGNIGAVFSPGAFVRISSSGQVTLIMPTVEMGQGSNTSVSMMIAEELDISLDNLKLLDAAPDESLYGNPIYKVQLTGGSTTTRAWWLPLRKAGASARSMLVTAAANAWKVDPATCRTEAGKVFHDASQRSANYGDLAERAALLTPPADPPIKDPSQFKLIGKSHKRLDTPDKVNGVAKYGIDALPKNVKIATLASSPVFGGKVKSVNEGAALAIAGVRQVVVLDDLVAVVADHMGAARQGLIALDIKWIDGPNAGVTQAQIWEGLQQASLGEAVVAKDVGDPVANLKGTGIVEETYRLPFLAHAPMEPMNCTVEVRADACEVWTGTQVIGRARDVAAQESGLKVEQVTIHSFLLGGGFGRRLETDGVQKAVRIAKQVKGPVKVVWSREEDIQQENYRPVYLDRMTARIENGKVVAWNQRIVGAALLARWLPGYYIKGIDYDAVEGGIDQPYDLPHSRIEFARYEAPAVPTSFWRGVGPNSTIFSTECFMDRLAKTAGSDPVEFRRQLLGKSPRVLAALNLAVEKSDWNKPLPAVGKGTRVGRGVAMQWSFGSFLAAVVEVAVSDDGEVRVTRVTCAVDCGTVVNPDGVVSQVEGGVIFGISAVLHGQITVEGGKVQQSNFHDYRVLRINETPTIDVHLIASGEAPGGIGEPGTVVIQPAVANAIYAATGRQMTLMPIDRALLARASA
jgi:isoquinoline 1-oxidoreductase beta subunit